MKQILFLFAWTFTMTVAAQTAEVDSISINDFYSTETVDSIDCAELETPPIPQIPFEEWDSLTMSSLDDRYVVVYKDGKCACTIFSKRKTSRALSMNTWRWDSAKSLRGNSIPASS